MQKDLDRGSAKSVFLVAYALPSLSCHRYLDDGHLAKNNIKAAENPIPQGLQEFQDVLKCWRYVKDLVSASVQLVPILLTFY
jgi:hypothetical protein